MLVLNLIRFNINPRMRALVTSFVFWLMVVQIFLLVLKSTGVRIKEILQPPYRENILDYDVGSRNQTFDNMSIAQQLHKNIRIHCLLQLTNEHERRKSKHILKTWGRRCNLMHLIESKDPEQAYRRIYNMYSLDLHWLLHVHVDSYIIMENLRYKLASYDPTNSIYFSAYHKAYPYAHVSLRNSTDYIYSRGALQQLVAQNCLSTDLARCLANMEEGPNGQLYPFQVPDELLPFPLRMQFWFWPFIHRAIYSDQGFNSTYADNPIALPYASANQLYVLEYLLYHLRPYGHMNAMPALPQGSIVKVPALPVNNSLATHLFKKVRILCMVLTHPEMYERVAKPIHETWGRHCNKLILFSSREQKIHNDWGVTTVALNVTEGYYYLWSKAKAAFKYVHQHYLDEADWFFKADDDTFAIMENMRFMLHTQHPDDPIHFGYKFRKDIKQGYMSGGAGYVLSREAVRRLVKGIDLGLCNRNKVGTEDFEMGVCLSRSKVRAGDSRDKQGRQRFFPLSWEHMMIPGRMDDDFWLHEFTYYKLKEGLECCSTYAITIHYVFYYQFYLYEYLLYKSRPYGIIMGHEPLVETADFKWTNFLNYKFL